MAHLFRNSSPKNRFQTAVWTIKLAFLSIGIISTVLLLKLAIPYCLNLLLSTLPRLFISFRSWLSPPYLYILVNFIIISIAASSTFQQKLSEKKENEAENPPEKPVISIQKSVQSPPETWSHISDEKQEPNPSESAPHIRRSTETYRKTLRSTASSEKPLKHLGVAKPKKHDDTLDATWKAITEGRGRTLTRPLKKSDTWDVQPRVIIADTEPVPARREMRKSETFNDPASSRSRNSVGGGLRRENSTSRDELNRRVEAFIKKFNNEIRLQRQESYEHYMEMVNRGVY